MIHNTNITLDLTNAGSCYPLSLVSDVFKAFYEVATFDATCRMTQYGCRPYIYKLLNVKLFSRLVPSFEMTENSLSWKDAKIEKNGAAYEVEILNLDTSDASVYGRFLSVSAHHGEIYNIIDTIYTQLRSWLIEMGIKETN